jgi:hypothetical protein
MKDLWAEGITSRYLHTDSRFLDPVSPLPFTSTLMFPTSAPSAISHRHLVGVPKSV